MKYIRTPIGIYDLENSIWFDFDGLCKYHISHCEYYENNPDECKTSDLLEELCDEFVGYVDGCIPFVWRFNTIDKYRERDLFIKEILENKGTEEIIYGAIYTDKGLIYVAKMNEKGELELI